MTLKCSYIFSSDLPTNSRLDNNYLLDIIILALQILIEMLKPTAPTGFLSSSFTELLKPKT